MEVKHPVLLGNITEQVFICECLRHGLKVFRPVFSGCCKYDCIVDVFGRLVRVQVKTMCRNILPGHREVYYHASFDSSNHQLYKREDLDFFALYHPVISKFFIMPYLPLRGVSVTLSGVSKYSKYIDNWSFETI